MGWLIISRCVGTPSVINLAQHFPIVLLFGHAPVVVYPSNKVLQNPHEFKREIASLMSYESFTLLIGISGFPPIIGWLL
jgi:hypothetical protein